MLILISRQINFERLTKGSFTPESSFTFENIEIMSLISAQLCRIIDGRISQNLLYL